MVKGKLLFFSETGMEGGIWSFQDGDFIKDDDHWDMKGLHELKDGDKLTIFDKNDSTKVIWEGSIKLKHFPVFTEHAFGCWIHADQEGIDRETWAKWFFEEYPAEWEKT